MNSINKKRKIWKKEEGFSMFIAIIIMSALTLIAFSVANISVKETEFSALNKESQYAIFAADAGIECAVYWDTKPAVSKFDPATPGTSINCNGVSLATGNQIAGTSSSVTTRIGGGNPNIISVFGFSLGTPQNPNNACVIVNVTKNPSGTTHIASYGYNNCNMSDPRRVERGIEVRY
jgi:hypothetical protein